MRWYLVKFTLVLWLFLLWPGIAFSGQSYDAFLQVNAVLRNDLYTAWKSPASWNNILENRLLLSKNSEDWSFYADGRFYLYAGDLSRLAGESSASLMRSFVRYSSALGVFTLGKNYINLGPGGMFNVFENDKQINLSDISYDPDGLLALEWLLPLGSLSGCKLYAGNRQLLDSLGRSSDHVTGGLAVYSHLAGFDWGAVVNHKGKNINSAGIYFKGDALLGLTASLAWHVNDLGKEGFAEASLVADYSFFSPRLFLQVACYFNEGGAKQSSDYVLQADGYFFARQYAFASVRYVYDEFIQFHLSSFYNLVDKSALLTAASALVIANGLAATLQVSWLSGTKMNDEYSRLRAGEFITLLRVEARL